MNLVITKKRKEKNREFNPYFLMVNFLLTTSFP